MEELFEKSMGIGYYIIAKIRLMHMTVFQYNISLMFLFPLLRTAAYSAFELFALISCCSFKATIGFFLEALEIRVIHLFLIKEIHYPAILLRS
jgi:hypothetical protein